MNIDELTIGEAKQLSKMFGKEIAAKTHSIPVGECVFIRTVTMHYTGRITSVTDYDLVLEDASWIADSGRFSTALKNGDLSEVEPFPGSAIIPLGCIVDISAWNHKLPREVK